MLQRQTRIMHTAYMIVTIEYEPSANSNSLLILLCFFLQEYFEFQETHRSRIFSTLSRKYHAIGPLLIKVEGLVVSTNTGKSPRLKQYYAYWEKRIFDALLKVRVHVCGCGGVCYVCWWGISLDIGWLHP